MRTPPLLLFLLLCTCVPARTDAQAQIPDRTMTKEAAKAFKITDWQPLLDRLNYDNDNIAAKGMLYFEESDDYLLTGYDYGEFYDWDIYFENLYLANFGVSDYCFSNLKTFLKRQHLNGFVSRTLIEPRPYQQFKPFLAQIAFLGSKQTNDFLWLTERVDGAENSGPAEGGIMDEKTYVDGLTYYERLQKYVDFWFWFQDFDKNGLPVWNSADHSGMDNQFSRAGSFNAFRVEGVDLACYLYRELKNMEVLAHMTQHLDDEKRYKQQAEELAANIRKYLWNEEDGFFYDRDERTGEQIKVKSVAGFMPLFAGVATFEQAERLVQEHLTNEEEFWLPYPIPAYAKTEPDYDQSAGDHGCNWRGTAWIPTNYMVFHGLLDYGYRDLAKELADKTFRMVMDRNPTTREYYNAETGAGLGLDPFWGWSTLAYFMPLEWELNYNPTSVHWQSIIPLAKDYLGLEFPAHGKARK